MMEKKENLLKRKEEIKEMSKKIINEIGISLDDRSKSSIELCKVINLFLNAINKNSISLRSTLKKIEVRFYYLFFIYLFFVYYFTFLMIIFLIIIIKNKANNKNKKNKKNKKNSFK